MHRRTRCLSRVGICRLNRIRIVRNPISIVCYVLLIIGYLYPNLFRSEYVPSSSTTRLFPDMPITTDLRSYSFCPPEELHLINITLEYHRNYDDEQICFLIDQFDGGRWNSYVTHEFAEILSHLKELGIQHNIPYRAFPNERKLGYSTDLPKYFLNACDMDENIPKESQIPIIALFWDVKRVLSFVTRVRLEALVKSIDIHLIIFVDDLHYVPLATSYHRQFLFHDFTTEILTTYPYLFHNYYYDIPRERITWLPHAASTLSYRSLNKSAENVLFVSGANLIDWYPCRSRAFELCDTRKDLVSCLEHPGYAETMKNDSRFYYGGKRYFSYMRQYVFGLGTCQSVHYAIAKLFELPANGLVLVTTNDLGHILESLSFYPDKHYLAVNCSSKENLINELIRIQNIPKEKIFEIRKESQELIFQRHLTNHRAELVHVRLLARALILSSKSDEERKQWEQWGRNC